MALTWHPACAACRAAGCAAPSAHALAMAMLMAIAPGHVMPSMACHDHGVRQHAIRNSFLQFERSRSNGMQIVCSANDLPTVGDWQSASCLPYSSHRKLPTSSRRLSVGILAARQSPPRLLGSSCI